MRVRSIGLGFVLASSGYAAEAHGHSAGQPGPDCFGCHSGGDYEISVTTSPADLSPGGSATVTVSVASSGSVAGMFVAANVGALSAIGGQGLAAVPAGLTHTSPKPLSGGQVSFSFGFEVPAAPGAVRFDVSTLVGNGNASSSGDRANRGWFDFVYGCAPATYYRDLDGDGFGSDELPLVHCANGAPSGYAVDGGDCNDSKDSAHPGAVEVCNQQDDDCDGAVDDDAIPVALYPDADGDGYYGFDERASGDMMTGCVPTEGYAAESGDCVPDDASVNPGAEEICNLVDDNCDGRVDERVRPRCGEGWCEREASTCDAATCFPGDPSPESCNLLDDDCDGLVDEDAPCPAGQFCIAAVCSDAQETAPAPSSGGGCAVGGRGGALLAFGWLFAAFAVRRRVSRRGTRR